MNAIMDEIRAEWHDSHIWNAGQPDLKTMTPPSLAAHYSCSLTPHTPVGICCEHAGIMQRTDDKGRIRRTVTRAGHRLPAP